MGLMNSTCEGKEKGTNFTLRNCRNGIFSGSSTSLKMHLHFKLLSFD